MKAKVLATGEIIEVKEWFGSSDGFYSTLDMNRFFQKSELEILPDTPKRIIEGWVMRDDNNEVGIYRDKPIDEDGYWDLTGDQYDLFPDITPDMNPKKYKITITPME